MSGSDRWRIVFVTVVWSSMATPSLLGQIRFVIQRDCALLPSEADWDLGGFDTMEVDYRDGLFQMWYGASDSGNFRNGQQIGYAWSLDGCTWERHELNPVLTNVLSWESAGVYAPTVIRDDEGYKMWFKGMVSTEQCDIGYAVSEDPVSWERYSDQPVLRPGLQGVDSCVFDPNVYFDGTTYHMWYSYMVNGGTEEIHYATSNDGIHWDKYARNPVIRGGARSPTVVFDEKTESFEMWYSESFSSPQLFHAGSVDGKNWTLRGSPSLAGSGASRVANPTVVLIDDVYHLWFNTSGGGVWYEDIRYGTSEWILPRASFRVEGVDADGETGVAPLHVTLDASKSASPDPGGVTSYSWDFGDGTTGEGVRVEHEFPVGEYTVELTIVDARRRRSTVARNVRAVHESGPVEPWSAQDIGSVTFPGASVLEGDCLVIAEARGDIGSGEDRAHFVHQRVTGDVRLEAQVTEYDASSTSEMGLILREGLETDARSVGLILRPGRIYLISRLEVGDRAKSKRHAEYDELPIDLRLERQGDLVLARYSLDGGSSWTWIDEVAFDEPLAPDVYLGVAASGRTPNVGVARVCGLEIEASDEPVFRRGEVNGDGDIDVTDGIFILAHLFVHGEAPSCLKAADTTNDGRIDQTDAAYLFAHLFKSGPPLDSPSEICGFDPLPDELTCESFDGCR